MHFADLLSQTPLLHWLHLVQPGGVVTLRLERASGQQYVTRLRIRPLSHRSAVDASRSVGAFARRFLSPHGLHFTASGDSWHYAITPAYGYFVLTQCIESASYENAVNRFFQAVVSHHVPNVVLDLRFNTGGEATVADAWLAHLPPKYEDADAISVSPERPAFHGKLYVLQGWDTFSSAMTLDDALTGPGLGVRVGQPIGEATGGWGSESCDLVLPESGVCFSVSGAYTPPVKGKVRPTLQPQIPLGTTVRDVQKGIDPVAQWLSRLGAEGGTR